MSRIVIAPFAALALFLAGCAGGANETTDPAPLPTEPADAEVALGETDPPEPLAVEDVDFPDYAERTLSNGARLIVVENSEQPVVSIQLMVPGGSASDPDPLAGLASLTASQIDQGTESMTAEELAEAVDFLGANLGASASNDWSSIYLTTVTDFLDEGLDIMADVVLRPTFPEEELAIEKQRRLSALRLQRSQPAALAQEFFTENIYGEHPYGQTESVETIEAIDAAELERFHEQYYAPEEALFVVAGDVDPDDVARDLERAFAGWEGSAPNDMVRAEPPTRSDRRMIFVHKPGSVQAVIRLGHLMPSATNADWVSLDVANQVLGSGSAQFNAWMMEILREEKGYTYGAYSSMSERPGPGYFVMNGEFRNEVADSSLMIMLDLAERLRAGDIPPEDLEDAKLYLTGSFPLRIEMPQQVAGQVASNRMLGRPDSYLEQYRSRVAATGAAEVAQVSRANIRPDRSLIVVVGDATEVLEGLRPFADEVELVDTEGEPLDYATLAAAAEQSAQLSFDVSELEPRELTYGMMFQGNQVATIVNRWTRQGDTFVVVSEQNAGGPTIVQETEFDAMTFAPIRTTTAIGPTNEFTIEVEDGRARGQGFDPQRGPQDVDVEIAPGTALEGQLDVALAVHDFDDVGEFTLRMLSGAGSIQAQNVEMTGQETVEVPAGTFETYRLQVGGEQPMTVWVTQSEPHLVVKREITAPTGQTIQMVLTSM